jgi:1-acyl-sn-glycerol-3-phosphate acyltransferase
MQSLLPEFIPAKPTAWFIRAAQTMVRAELALTNRLHLSEQDLDMFRQLPTGSGIILASNHADETDPLICLELSRRSKKQFITMCNREAFDEFYGLAGLALQRLGLFSVKRGVHDSEAKNYAIETVRQGNNVLVIFPEGEIFYLNELVQPFHSGAVAIGLQAIIDNRKINPKWTAFILPMVIKYHYTANIESELEKRIAKMEARLMLKPNGDTLQSRLMAVQGMLLNREKRLHALKLQPASQLDLTQQLHSLENKIVAEIEKRHHDLPISAQAPIIDKTWQLEAEIREGLKKQLAETNRLELQQELASLNEVAQLSSWRPSYYINSASMDRLAEAVLKVEREFYRIKRPRHLANRQVTVKFAEPIDMGDHVSDYMQDPHTVSHGLTQTLHEKIQRLINTLTSKQ